MSYIGSTPTTQSFIAGTDYFNGTGSQTAFTLSRSVVSVNDIEVVINNVEQQPNTAYTVSGTTITFTSAPSAGTANIYVRYLSTTTQSITPSQNTVSYSTLNSDNQSKLGISFKNRIINGGATIDQRTAGVATTGSTGNTWIADRWQLQTGSTGATWTTQQVAITDLAGFSNALYLTITSPDASIGSAEYYQVWQAIEGLNVSDLNWGTNNAQSVTVSFWIKTSVTGTYQLALSNSDGTRNYPIVFTVSAANTWQKVTATVPGPTNGTFLTTNGVGIGVRFGFVYGSGYAGATPNTWVSGSGFGNAFATTTNNFVSTNGATIYLTGFQLEVGTQATTFDSRSYGTELNLCQRYYQKWTYDGTGGEVAYGFGAQQGTTYAYIYVPYLQTMRTEPTAAISNLQVSNYRSFSTDCTLTSIQPGYSSCTVIVGFAASGSADLPVYLQNKNNLAGYFSLSAEI